MRGSDPRPIAHVNRCFMLFLCCCLCNLCLCIDCYVCIHVMLFVCVMSMCCVLCVACCLLFAVCCLLFVVCRFTHCSWQPGNAPLAMRTPGLWKPGLPGAQGFEATLNDKERPRACHMFFVAQRIIMICYIARRFRRRHVLDK